jgi:hypothetical protein
MALLAAGALGLPPVGAHPVNGSIQIEPKSVAADTPGFELLVRGFAAFGANTKVGVAFGGKLLRIDPHSKTASVLRVRVPRLDLAFEPAPQAGDRLIVAVYEGDRPVSAPASISVDSKTDTRQQFTRSE